MNTTDGNVDPIDYFNPKRTPEPASAEPQAPAKRPAAVVPVEFDTVLSRSTDHAGLAAVGAALRAAKIPSFRADDGALVGREFTLYIRSADQPIAAPLAAQIFARRERVRKLNPKKKPEAFDPLDVPISHDGGGFYF